MNDKGVALVITLWVLVLLTAVAINFSFSTRYGSASTRNFKEETRAYYLAISAYEDALAYLVTDKDLEVDFIDKEGNFLTDAERDPVTGTRELEGAVVTLSISDEESRLNINHLLSKNKYDIILNLLDYAGVPNDTTLELMESIADWMDSDELHRPLGAEDEYYETLGYRARNNPLRVPEELLLIKGFIPAYYYGTEYTPSLHNLITTWGEGLNINTVSEDVLAVLGLGPYEIRAIVSERQNRRGLRTVPRGLPGIRLTKSFNFRIQVSASVAGNPQAVRITSIVKKTTGPVGPELAILYWKEYLESSGA